MSDFSSTILILGASSDIGGEIIRSIDDGSSLIFAHYNRNEEKIKKLQKEIQAIKKRNLHVEMDKAWELSDIRIFSIAAIVYVVYAIVLFLNLNSVNNALLSALVPAIGYYLSTQSLPILKEWWIKSRVRGKK